jgi:hypothetical protein
VRFDDIPIVLKVPEAVAHGVGIFGHNEWAVRAGLSGIALEISRKRIHRTINIRVRSSVGRFELDRTGGISLLDPLVARHQVRAIA